MFRKKKRHGRRRKAPHPQRQAVGVTAGFRDPAARNKLRCDKPPDGLGWVKKQIACMGDEQG